MAEIADLWREVRAGDHDRFLAIQLAPSAKRPALYVLTAFHLELARIAETVSEPMLGQIRLTWWREALEEIISGKASRNHPVVQGLAELYKQQPAMFMPLLQMIEARMADIDESLLATKDGWESYLDGTAGALHYAFALVLDGTAAEKHSATIVEQARAYAKIGLIRAIPYMSAQGFMRFPQSSVESHGINDLSQSRGLANFARETVSAIELKPHALPRSLLPLRGLARLGLLHRKSILQVGGDPFRVIPTRLAAVCSIYQIKYF